MDRTRAPSRLLFAGLYRTPHPEREAEQWRVLRLYRNRPRLLHSLKILAPTRTSRPSRHERNTLQSERLFDCEPTAIQSSGINCGVAQRTQSLCSQSDTFPRSCGVEAIVAQVLSYSANNGVGRSGVLRGCSSASLAGARIGDSSCAASCCFLADC